MWSYCIVCVADDGCMQSIHVTFGTNQSSVDTHDFPWGGSVCQWVEYDLRPTERHWLMALRTAAYLKIISSFLKLSKWKTEQPEGQGEEENASVSSWRSYGVCAYLLTVLIVITVTYARIRTKYYIIIKSNDTQVNTKAEISYYLCLV